MRIFVALKISQDLQEKISNWTRDWQYLPVRWIAPKNLHVTIVPPWDELNISDVKRLLTDVTGQVRCFDIRFDKVTYGPNENNPRLIWASGSAPSDLARLKKVVEEILGIKPEDRNFLLHLTLARFRSEDFRSFPIKKINEKINWNDTVKSIVLIESMLLPGGADYKIIHEINL